MIAKWIAFLLPIGVCSEPYRLGWTRACLGNLLPIVIENYSHNKYLRQSACWRYVVLLLADQAGKTGKAGSFHVEAGLARPLALFLDPPVGVVTDAARLTDDQVGGG